MNEQTNQQTDFANQWITKQAAIDALGDMVMNWTDSDYELGQLNQWKADRKAIIDLPSAQPQLDAEFAEAVRTMFANVWECEIDHPKYQNTVGEILEKVIELHNSVPPMKYDEWCETCKEYDQTTHSCPRFNHVIRETLDDVRKEAMAQRWIPVTERLPEEDGQYLITVKYVHEAGYDDIYAEHGEWIDGKWDMFCFGHCGKVESITAWMPLPEPYKGVTE